MTDLRGVLPGQRPPVDARVLDEPTSEVPIIQPAGVPSADPEPEATATDTEPEATTEEAAESTAADTETEAAEPEPATEEPAAAAETATAEVEPEATAEQTEPAAPPTPSFTPPVPPAFGSGVSTPAPASEMAKMSWTPAPAPPPGLVPVDAPEPAAEV
ncbi:MAG TPA: hypothetical protein VIL37_10125, partial [Natronosporangium sp.]